MQKSFKFKVMRVVADRATTLLNDGYILLVKTESMKLQFYKLRHKVNGNVVVIEAYPDSNFFVQKTNGRIVSSGAIIPPSHEKMY